MRTLLVLGSLLVLVLPAAGSGGNKHVVAPPADFPLLRLPDPASTAQRSHTALVPVRLAALESGRFGARLALPFDDPDQTALVVFEPRAGAWSVLVTTDVGPRRLAELADPGSPELAASAFGGAGARVERAQGALPFARDARAVDVFRFERTGARSFALAIEAAQDASAGDLPDGFVAISGRRDVELVTQLLHHELVTGRELGLATKLSDASVPGAVLVSALVRLFPPDGAPLEIPMTPSGDGFEVRFHAGAAGAWLAQVDAVGFTPEGDPFRRTTETLFPVADVRAALVGARGELQGARVALTVAVELEGAPRVQIGGFLHAAHGTPAGTDDGTPNETPIAWVGRIADVPSGAGEIALELDAAWLAGMSGALELRDVRLQDIDTHVVLARAERLPVVSAMLAPLPLVPTPGARGALGPLGPSPSAPFDPPRFLPTRGTKTVPPAPSVPGLMLVHGYCSGGVWPLGDFTGATPFADFSANRSHDAFALLLRDQAEAVYDTFGVVGHSQGGAAALHLFTFYESGLDGAQGDRLIQSVGTPYQGTALAGSLAALAQSLGIGCGENTDMSYDGAALWLANIPSAERARVHFWTTSFFTGQAFDNCLFATGVFLTNPEDGTTEMFAGQLPGAVSMGHVNGWCHTTGMNYPPQYQDSARNADMNAHAAR